MSRRILVAGAVTVVLIAGVVALLILTSARMSDRGRVGGALRVPPRSPASREGVARTDHSGARRDDIRDAQELSSFVEGADPQGLSEMLAQYLRLRPSDSQAKRMADVMGRMAPEEILRALLRSFNSPEPDVRCATLTAATLYPNKAMMPLFVKGLQDPTPIVRVKALRYLASMGVYDSDIVQEVKRIASDDSDKVARKEAAWFSREHPEVIDRELAQSLCAIVADESMTGYESVGRHYAAWALCRSETSGPNLVQVMETVYSRGRNGRSDELALAMAAAGALARRGHGTEAILTDLLRNVDSPDEIVRAGSIMGLTAFVNMPSAREATLRVALAEKGPSAGNVFYAAGEFGRATQDRAFVNAFSKRLNEVSRLGKSSWFGLELVTAAAKMGSSQACKMLLDAAKDQTVMVSTRLVAVGTLRKVSHEYCDIIFAGDNDHIGTSTSAWEQKILEKQHD